MSGISLSTTKQRMIATAGTLAVAALMLMSLMTSAGPASAQDVVQAPPAAAKAGPPTETGFVVLTGDGRLLLSNKPMGKAVAMPGGGTFITDAPPAGGDKQTGQKPPVAGAESTWVTAGQGRQAGAGSAPPAGDGRGMVMTMTSGESEGPKITTFVLDDTTKGVELLKVGDRVTVQYREVDGRRIAELVTTPAPEKGKGK